VTFEYFSGELTIQAQVRAHGSIQLAGAGDVLAGAVDVLPTYRLRVHHRFLDTDNVEYAVVKVFFRPLNGAHLADNVYTRDEVVEHA
jgi:hypothetical protein